MKTSCLRPDDHIATVRVDEHSEIYTIRNSVWKKAGMEPYGGRLCIGCLEKRIGRKLKPKDFLHNHPFNNLPGTERLLERREENGETR